MTDPHDVHRVLVVEGEPNSRSLLSRIIIAHEGLLIASAIFATVNIIPLLSSGSLAVTVLLLLLVFFTIADGRN